METPPSREQYGGRDDSIVAKFGPSAESRGSEVCFDPWNNIAKENG